MPITNNKVASIHCKASEPDIHDIIVKLKVLASDSDMFRWCVGGRQQSFLHLLEGCALPTSYIEICEFSHSGAPCHPAVAVQNIPASSTYIHDPVW